MTTPNGEVNFSITDGALAAINAPSGSVQAKIGCASSGIAFQLVSTTSIAALIAAFTSGPLVEASALVAQAGGQVLACMVPSNTPGLVYGSNVATTAVTAATNATPIVVTSGTPHKLATGDVATIASALGNTAANGTFKVTVVDATHFSLDGSAGNGVWTSGGTIQSKGIHAPSTGTSVPTVTGVPLDRFDVDVNVITGGTIGVAGIVVQISLDNGRSYGPPIALGTANTYAMTGSGLTLNFAAGTLVVGTTFYFTTVPPKWLAADVTTAILTTLQGTASDWGAGIHIIGECSATNAATFQTNLDTIFTNGRYTFAFVDVRDFDPLTDANEAAWMASIIADYASLSAKRICAGAGFVNIQSPIKTVFAGAPAYRRPITWAAAKRAVTVPIQVLYGRVKDGSLPATTGPGTNALIGDGFVYHDERLNPGLNAARFMSARTRIRRPGVFVTFPNLMSPPGSDYTMVPFRQVIDAACSVCRSVLELYVEDTVRLYPLTNSKAGQIVEQDAHEIEQAGDVVLQTELIGKGAVSDAFLTIDRTTNIQVTKLLNGTVSVLSLGYILEIDISIGFVSPALNQG